MVMNQELHEQIIKNPSNMGLLYNQAGDLVSLDRFRYEANESKSMKKLNAKNSVVSILT